MLGKYFKIVLDKWLVAWYNISILRKKRKRGQLAKQSRSALIRVKINTLKFLLTNGFTFGIIYLYWKKIKALRFVNWYHTYVRRQLSTMIVESRGWFQLPIPSSSDLIRFCSKRRSAWGKSSSIAMWTFRGVTTRDYWTIHDNIVSLDNVDFMQRFPQEASKI